MPEYSLVPTVEEKTPTDQWVEGYPFVYGDSSQGLAP